MAITFGDRLREGSIIGKWSPSLGVVMELGTADDECRSREIVGVPGLIRECELCWGFFGAAKIFPSSA